MWEQFDRDVIDHHFVAGLIGLCNNVLETWVRGVGPQVMEKGDTQAIFANEDRCGINPVFELKFVLWFEHGKRYLAEPHVSVSFLSVTFIDIRGIREARIRTGEFRGCHYVKTHTQVVHQ